ncbi:MAG TPA: P1 family peptidase [Geminicoccaceae bacterium]|nr:P1 family peptidase [Geminicoccaceae bacterium]
MIRPGASNSLTDVPGLLVGSAEDAVARTGVTVVLPDAAAVAAVDVRGGGPGTRETDALAPESLVQEIHGLVLGGGSAFGLDAAGALAGWLAARGRGFKLRDAVVPIVPAAILFDLANGGDKAWGDAPPYRALALRAAEAAGREVAQGNRGAGFGAMAGNLKGGLGTASAVDAATGLAVAALVAVNSAGSVVMPGTGTFWAWYLEQEGEMGGQAPPRDPVVLEPELKRGHGGDAAAEPGGNTAIGVIATDAALARPALGRLAIMGHDGFARAIRPAHTPVDGDTLFALATGAGPLPERRDALLRLGHMAADCVARAVCRGILAAEGLGGMPGYTMLHGSKLGRGAATEGHGR